MKIMAVGVWDMFHIGHLRFIAEAKKLGDQLVVGVLTDEYCKKYKREPIINRLDRMCIVKSIKFVDHVVEINEDNYEFVMKMENPDFVVHGDDWKDAPSIKLAKKLGIKTKIIKYFSGISTTKIIKRCKNAKL